MYNHKKQHCRWCRKVFCCSDCRIHHEIQIHRFDCTICSNGVARVSEIKDIKHVMLNHWPLECVHCNLIFQTFEEILHNKCCVNLNEKMIRSYASELIVVESSPILNANETKAFNKICTILTSTPMQRPLKLKHFEKASLTPIEQKEPWKSDSKRRSSIKPTVRFQDSHTVIKEVAEEIKDTESTSDKTTMWESAVSFTEDQQKPNICTELVLYKEVCIQNYPFNNIQPSNPFESLLHTNPHKFSFSQFLSNAPQNTSVHQTSLITIFTPNINLHKSITEKIEIEENDSESTFWYSFTEDNSCVESPPKLKRRFSNVTETSFEEEPEFKRMKLGKVTCRKTIRELPPLTSSLLFTKLVNESIYSKIRVNMSTQTDE